MPSPVPGPMTAIVPVASSSGPIVLSAAAGSNGNAWPTAVKSLITSARGHCSDAAISRASHTILPFVNLPRPSTDGSCDRDAASAQRSDTDFAPIALDELCAADEIGACIDANVRQRKRCVGEREPRVGAADIADEHRRIHRGSIRAACNSVS